MVPLIILIVVILLLRAIATSKTAANVTQVHKTVCSAPTAGDSFTQGNTIAAGVPEPPVRFLGPPVPVHCNHIVVGTFYCGLPAHVVYPIAPPPITITNPAPVPPKFTPPVYSRPAPMPISPKIYMTSLPSPAHCLTCNCFISYGGGGSGRTCLGGGGLSGSCDIIFSSY